MLEMQSAKEIGKVDRKRVEAVVETLANLRSQGETLAEVAHDARNMVTALGLYCELLEEPGVLTPPYIHYGSELRLVATASRRLVEKLVALDSRKLESSEAHFAPVNSDAPIGANAATATEAPRESDENLLGRRSIVGALAGRDARSSRWDLMPAEPIVNLAAELLANRNLLAALAGPSIALTVDEEGGALPVWLTGEDLTRVLVNLVKNAAEAMPSGGRIQLSLRERRATGSAKPAVVLAIEDNGPGIPLKTIEKIFDSGYTTRSKDGKLAGNWPATHRGLGLSITRSIVSGAGGSILVSNRSRGGARFEIELPVRER